MRIFSLSSTKVDFKEFVLFFPRTVCNVAVYIALGHLVVQFPVCIFHTTMLMFCNGFCHFLRVYGIQIINPLNELK